MPVVNSDGEAVGVITSTDLLEDLKDGRPVSEIMTDNVFTVPKYNDVSIAARIMRNHKIHHVVVTHENQVVGILSSYDLLKLVEDHRFIMKNAPTESATLAIGLPVVVPAVAVFATLAQRSCTFTGAPPGSKAVMAPPEID